MDKNINRDYEEVFICSYDAGYDAGKNGSNTANTHYIWFATKEKMLEWERGQKAGAIDKTKTLKDG